MSLLLFVIIYCIIKTIKADKTGSAFLVLMLCDGENVERVTEMQQIAIAVVCVRIQSKSAPDGSSMIKQSEMRHIHWENKTSFKQQVL